MCLRKVPMETGRVMPRRYPMPPGSISKVAHCGEAGRGGLSCYALHTVWIHIRFSVKNQKFCFLMKKSILGWKKSNVTIAGSRGQKTRRESRVTWISLLEKDWLLAYCRVRFYPGCCYFWIKIWRKRPDKKFAILSFLWNNWENKKLINQIMSTKMAEIILCAFFWNDLRETLAVKLFLSFASFETDKPIKSVLKTTVICAFFKRFEDPKNGPLIWIWVVIICNNIFWSVWRSEKHPKQWLWFDRSPWFAHPS